MLNNDPDKVVLAVLNQLKIDDSNLRNEIKNQPALYFYWAYQSDIAEEAANQMLIAVKKIEAEVAQEAREAFQGAKKLTDPQTKELVNCHQKVITARNSLGKSKLIASMLTDAKFGFIQRGKMLLALSSKIYGAGIDDFEPTKIIETED